MEVVLQQRVKNTSTMSLEEFLTYWTPLLKHQAWELTRKRPYETASKEDLVQVGLTRLWEKREEYDPTRGVTEIRYFMKVAKYAMIDYMRKVNYFLKGCWRDSVTKKARKERDRTNVEDVHYILAAREELDEKRILDFLKPMLKTLDKVQRLVVLLLFVEGMTQEEVAESIGYSPAHVSKEFKKAFIEMRRIYLQDNPGAVLPEYPGRVRKLVDSGERHRKYNAKRKLIRLEKRLARQQPKLASAS